MQIDIPADAVNNELDEIGDYNLGVELAKSLTLSAAQTAGIVGGFVVVAIAWDAGSRLYKRFKKPAPELYLVTDLPKAAEN